MFKLLASLFVILLVPATLQATPVPCFDFDCANGVCEFDASCSTEQSSIWKYYWIFGDGAYNLGGSVQPSHTYNVCYPEVTLELWTWNAEKVSVSCMIHAGNSCPGPPVAATSGRCD